MGRRRRKKVSSERTQSELRRLMEMFDGRCWWCRVEVVNFVQRHDEASDPRAPTKATRDHLHPRSKGGREAFDNLVLACSACNTARGDLMEWVWRRRLRQVGLDPPSGSDFRRLRRRWVEQRPTWFRAYLARKAERATLNSGSGPACAEPGEVG